jgi:tetratricopeptide (TPR) repeat protein
MIAVNILGIRITTMVPVLGATLLIGAVEYANCQVDLVELPERLSSTQGVVSKNQLLIPEKAQKAMDHAQVDFLHLRYESAQRDAQRALQIYPHCALAFTFQGILDLRDGNFSAAAQAFQRAIKEDPASGSAYIGLGIVYNTQGRFRDAIALFDRAAPFSPDSWLREFEAALAHLGVGEYDAGLKDITRAERVSGSDPEKLAGVAYLRGVAQCQMRDYAGANRYLQEAIRRDQNGTFSMLARKRLEQLGPAVRDLHESGADAETSRKAP